MTGEIELQMTIPTTDANGNTLVEAGLYTRGDQDSPDYADPASHDALMVARQVHAAIVKTSSISVEYTWTFRVAL